MGFFHKNVNERLAKHLEELERIGLLDDNWYWNGQKVLQLEKIDDKLLQDLIEFYKSRLFGKSVAKRLIKELSLLKRDLDALLKKHLRESEEKEEARLVKKMIRDIENLIENELPLRIGVVGYCPPSRFDEGKALGYLRYAFDNIQSKYPKRPKVVVSGLTNVGVLKLAYEEAKRRRWKTAGVACKKAYEFKNNWFPVDENPIIVGEEWGEESPTFLETIDMIVRVGGGKQSRRECAETKSMDKEVYEYELELIS